MSTLVRTQGPWTFAVVCLIACGLVSIGWADDKPAKSADKSDAAAEAKDSKDAPASDAKADKPADAPKKDDAKKEDKKKDDKKKEAKKDEPKADDAKPAAKPDDGAAAEKFQKKMTEWKRVLKDLRALQLKTQGAPAAEVASIQKQWDGLIAEGAGMLPELRELGKASFLASPNTDRELCRFLVKLAEDDLGRDDYESARDLSQLLIDNGYDDKAVFSVGGVSAFATNDFEKAQEYLKIADEAKLLSDQGSKLLPVVPSYIELWAKEKELRKAEAEKDDLPRVKLSTTKGDIVIELFENEAPETVGNFVSLVESKFYDNKSFHRVLPGFMAQGGCPKGDGTGGPGYNIYCECYKDNARMHFRGTLSMAHAGRDTGGSQFFLTFLPTPHLNGMHTVFGRVVEGMDVLSKLQRIDPDQRGKIVPDKIVKAEVLRKRDHKYEPNKVK